MTFELFILGYIIGYTITEIGKAIILWFISRRRIKKYREELDKILDTYRINSSHISNTDLLKEKDFDTFTKKH